MSREGCHMIGKGDLRAMAPQQVTRPYRFTSFNMMSRMSPPTLSKYTSQKSGRSLVRFSSRPGACCQLISDA